MELAAYSLAYRPYNIEFLYPLRSARTVLHERKGIILQLSAGKSRSYAEVLPLKHFGTETYEQACSFLFAAAQEQRIIVPPSLPAARYAIEVAQWHLANEVISSRAALPVVKLLDSTKQSKDHIQQALREGYRSFKMKVGMHDFLGELARVEEVVSHFPPQATLRLDANESLTVDQARQWIDSIASLPIEFFEQPLPRESLDELIALSEESPIEIALDESIASTADLIRCYERGFRGVYAVKPTRMTELQKFLQWREMTEAKISYSTAFESIIGSRFGLLLAASDRRNHYAVGYGVSQFLKKTPIVLQEQATLKTEHLLRIDLEAVWENLPTPNPT